MEKTWEKPHIHVYHTHAHIQHTGRKWNTKNVKMALIKRIKKYANGENIIPNIILAITATNANNNSWYFIEYICEREKKLLHVQKPNRITFNRWILNGNELFTDTFFGTKHCYVECNVLVTVFRVLGHLLDFHSIHTLHIVIYFILK